MEMAPFTSPVCPAGEEGSQGYRRGYCAGTLNAVSGGGFTGLGGWVSLDFSGLG